MKTAPKPLWLAGGNPYADDPRDGAAMAKKLFRLVDFERFLVAVNVLERGEERLKVLTGYYYTMQAAETARDALSATFPTCAVVSTQSKLDLEDDGHADARARYLGRFCGVHGDGVQ